MIVITISRTFVSLLLTAFSLSFLSLSVRWIFRRQIIAAINLRLIEPNAACRCLLPAKSISHYKSIDPFLSFLARFSRTSSR